MQINTVVAVIDEAGSGAAAAPAAEAASAAACTGFFGSGCGCVCSGCCSCCGPGTDVVMPQMGESIFEGTITKWLKQVGDTVQRDEPLFEISTDKVDAEIPSPAAGVLTEIKVAAGKRSDQHGGCGDWRGALQFRRAAPVRLLRLLLRLRLRLRLLLLPQPRRRLRLIRSMCGLRRWCGRWRRRTT